MLRDIKIGVFGTGVTRKRRLLGAVRTKTGGGGYRGGTYMYWT